MTSVEKMARQRAFREAAAEARALARDGVGMSLKEHALRAGVLQELAAKLEQRADAEQD